MSETIFDIRPIPKPRMTKADAWKKRPVVLRYWAYKDALKLEAKKIGYEPSDKIYLEYLMGMPKSWSKKKKAEMAGKPHKSKPDVDNLTKAFMDCLLDEDSHIYFIAVRKIWSYKSGILVAPNLEFFIEKPVDYAPKQKQKSSF